MTVRRIAGWLGALLVLGVVAIPATIVILGWRHPDSLTLPAPTGPYAVGRVVVDWRDDGRLDTFAPEPGTRRELPVWIWYPATRDSSQSPAEYMPPRLREAMQPNAPRIVRLVMDPLTIDRGNVKSHAFEAPALDASAGKLPVVLLKPALGAAVVQNSVLAEELASHGYVVVGSDSPYTTPGVAYQDGRIARRTAAGHPPETAPGHVSELAPGQANDFYLPVVDTWVKDNRFILDRLHILGDADPSGRFTGRLDLDAVGAVGHSIGGATALQFCHEDARCKAGVDLDGAPLGDVVRTGIAKPFLFLLADRPMFDTPESDLPDDQRALLTAINHIRRDIPARPNLLLLSGAAHFNLFDQAMLTEPTIWRLFGALGPIDQARGLEVMCRYVRAFFDAHLKHMPDRLFNGPSADFPEIRFK